MMKTQNVRYIYGTERAFNTDCMVHKGFTIPDTEPHAGIASEIIEMPADFAPMGCYLSFLGTQKNSS